MPQCSWTQFPEPMRSSLVRRMAKSNGLAYEHSMRFEHRPLACRENKFATIVWLSPDKQAEDHDPDGEFIRWWGPEGGGRGSLNTRRPTNERMYDSRQWREMPGDSQEKCQRKLACMMETKRGTVALRISSSFPSDRFRSMACSCNF